MDPLKANHWTRIDLLRKNRSMKTFQTFLLFLLCIASFSGYAQTKPKITFFGDSHSATAFGDDLIKNLQDKFDIHRLGSSGSRPKHWIGTPFCSISENAAVETQFGSSRKILCQHQAGDCKSMTYVQNPDGSCPIPTVSLRELIQKDKPDFVMISLGANLKDAGPKTVKKEISDLLTQLDDRPCFWIAPPYSSAERYKQQKNVYDFLATAKVAKKCFVYDSVKDTKGKTAQDQVHYSKDQEILKIWAGNAAKAFEAFAASQKIQPKD